MSSLIIIDRCLSDTCNVHISLWSTLCSLGNIMENWWNEILQRMGAVVLEMFSFILLTQALQNQAASSPLMIKSILNWFISLSLDDVSVPVPMYCRRVWCVFYRNDRRFTSCLLVAFYRYFIQLSLLPVYYILFFSVKDWRRECFCTHVGSSLGSMHNVH